MTPWSRKSRGVYKCQKTYKKKNRRRGKRPLLQMENDSGKKKIIIREAQDKEGRTLTCQWVSEEPKEKGYFIWGTSGGPSWEGERR